MDAAKAPLYHPCKTIRYISDNTGVKRENLGELSCDYLKKCHKYKSANEEDLWRISLGQELMSSREQRKSVIPGFTDHEINDILYYVCTS